MRYGFNISKKSIIGNVNKEVSDSLVIMLSWGGIILRKVTFLFHRTTFTRTSFAPISQLLSFRILNRIINLGRGKCLIYIMHHAAVPLMSVSCYTRQKCRGSDTIYKLQ